MSSSRQLASCSWALRRGKEVRTVTTVGKAHLVQLGLAQLDPNPHLTLTPTLALTLTLTSCSWALRSLIVLDSASAFSALVTLEVRAKVKVRVGVRVGVRAMVRVRVMVMVKVRSPRSSPRS